MAIASLDWLACSFESSVRCGAIQGKGGQNGPRKEAAAVLCGVDTGRPPADERCHDSTVGSSMTHAWLQLWEKAKENEAFAERHFARKALGEAMQAWKCVCGSVPSFC